jgi:hypothetical protein
VVDGPGESSRDIAVCGDMTEYGKWHISKKFKDENQHLLSLYYVTVKLCHFLCLFLFGGTGV